MSESQWKTVGRQHRIRVDHRGHASLIAESTCAIGITIHQLLQQLDDRAKSLTACAQFDLALKDAALMREMAPRSSLGYLRACDVYSSQGRQREVIDMCKRGLFAISYDDPDFQQLRVIKNEAQTISDQRVDFLSKLPIDVLTCNLMPRIMDSIMPFDSKIPSPLLYVSRAWHQCILQANNGLSFYANIDNNGTLKEGHDHLLRYAPFVTELDVNGVGHLLEHSTGPSLSNLFTRGSFTKLTTLNIQVDARSMIIMATRFKPALELVGSRLKHLSITKNPHYSASRGYSVILSDIIRCCDKLVSLTVDQFLVETASSSSKMECTEMRHLTILQASPRLSSQTELTTMLMAFPFLTRLAINPSVASTILAKIYHYCPLLEQLVYWDSDQSHDGTTATTFRGNSICVANQQMNLTMESIALCLMQQAASLDIFEYQGMFNSNDRLALTMLPDLGSFPKLRAISFRHVNASCIPFLLWVIQRAPHLRFIKLHHPVMDSLVIDAIMRLQHVHTLNITTQDGTTLLPLTKHHVRIGSRSTLRHIQVSTTGTMCTALWFQRIANLPNLASFELYVPKGILSTFAPFFQEMARVCEKLKWLKLVVDKAQGRVAAPMPSVASPVIGALTLFHNLSDLTLYACMISDTSLMLLSKMRNLRRLKLCTSFPIDPLTIGHLRCAVHEVVIEQYPPE